MTRLQNDQLARIARAVLDCPVVLQLYAGPMGRISSATPGGRVVGLLFQGQSLLVGVISRPDVAVANVVATVRKSVEPVVRSSTRVLVVVSST